MAERLRPSAAVDGACHHGVVQVLHVVGRSHRRGAEQVALELAAELDDLGHGNELVAVGPGHEGEVVPELAPLTSSNRHRPLTLVRAGLALRPVLRRSRPDLVLAHGSAAAAAAAIGAPRRPPLIVWQTILGMADRSFRKPEIYLWRTVVRRVDAVVALTEEMGDEAVRLGHRGPIWALPNARSAARFEGIDRAQARTTLRSEIGVGADVPLLGFVGYLVDQKRPTRAVEVLARTIRDVPDVRLVAVGAGPLADEVRGAADALGVADRLHLLGHRDDVPDLLAGFDALVLTSRDEGVPGVVIEAAMAGCPVITYRLGEVASVVEHGVTGHVVDDGVDAMARAVIDVLGDPDGRAVMSAAARAGSARFEMRNVARRYADAFEGLRIEPGSSNQVADHPR